MKAKMGEEELALRAVAPYFLFEKKRKYAKKNSHASRNRSGKTRRYFWLRTAEEWGTMEERKNPL